MENWKDIEYYEGEYQVSDMGNVRSLDRKVRNKTGYRISRGKVLKAVLTPQGYPSVTLYKLREQVKRLVSRLVAEAFVDNPDNLPCVLHKDDNPLNSEATNLFWGTHQDNVADKVSKDRQAKGTMHPKAKFTDDDIREIRKLRSEGMSSYKLAKKYNSTAQRILEICAFKRWKHVKSL